MPHARRVMDPKELKQIEELHVAFKEAIDGTEGKTLPEDEASRASSAVGSAGSAAVGVKRFSSALRSNLVKKLQGGKPST